MAHADWIIDIGPGAGHDGGAIVFEGTPADLVGGGRDADGAAPARVRRRVTAGAQADAPRTRHAVCLRWLSVSARLRDRRVEGATRVTLFGQHFPWAPEHRSGPDATQDEDDTRSGEADAA